MYATLGDVVNQTCIFIMFHQWDSNPGRPPCKLQLLRPLSYSAIPTLGGLVTSKTSLERQKMFKSLSQL